MPMNVKLKPQVLQKIPEAEAFLRYCERRSYKPRASIFRQDDASDCLYLILEGSVSVVVGDHHDPDHEMVMAYLNPGDFVGEMGLFGEERRTANVIARVECELAQISYDRFHQIRSQFPELIYALAYQLGNRLESTTRRMTDLAFVDVAGRVAQTLIDLTRQPDAMTHPDGMQIRITRQELGKIVGCSREMAGRVLKALEADGLIEVAGKTIVVLHAFREHGADEVISDSTS